MTTSLTGTEWQVTEAIVEGHPLPIDDIDAVLRFDDAGGFSAHACNYLDGTAEITDSTIVLSTMSTTEAFCGGPDGDIDRAIGSLEGPVQWSIVGDQLSLEGEGGTQLVLQVRATIYPDAQAREVLAGELDGWQYRLAVTGTADAVQSLLLESRDAPGRPWGMHEFGSPSPGESPLWSIIAGEIADQTLVAGFVPTGTTRVTHQATVDAAPVELTLHDVGDPDLAVAAGWVPEHSSQSVLIAYDANGAVTAEWRHVLP